MAAERAQRAKEASDSFGEFMHDAYDEMMKGDRTVYSVSKYLQRRLQFLEAQGDQVNAEIDQINESEETGESSGSNQGKKLESLVFEKTKLKHDHASLQKDLSLIATECAASSRTETETLLGLAAALPLCYSDPSYCARKRNKSFRDKIEKFYASSRYVLDSNEDVVVELKGQSPSEYPEKLRKQAWCHVLGEWLDSRDVKGAHIVQRSWEHCASHLFYEMDGDQDVVHHYRNGLSLYSQVEEQFDQGRIILLPMPMKDGEPVEWYIFVVDVDLYKKKRPFRHSFGAAKELTWHDMHMRKLSFLNRARPARRFLFFRFVQALLYSKMRRFSGYERAWALRPEAIWGSPDEKSTNWVFLHTFSKMVGVYKLPPGIQQICNNDTTIFPQQFAQGLINNALFQPESMICEQAKEETDDDTPQHTPENTDEDSDEDSDA